MLGHKPRVKPLADWLPPETAIEDKYRQLQTDLMLLPPYAVLDYAASACGKDFQELCDALDEFVNIRFGIPYGEVLTALGTHIAHARRVENAEDLRRFLTLLCDIYAEPVLAAVREMSSSETKDRP